MIFLALISHVRGFDEVAIVDTTLGVEYGGGYWMPSGMQRETVYEGDMP